MNRSGVWLSPTSPKWVAPQQKQTYAAAKAYAETGAMHAMSSPLPDGQYSYIGEDDYHASRRLSSSGARLLLPPSVPAKFKYAQENPRPDKRAYDIGHVAHTLTLGKGAGIAVLDPAVDGVKKDGTIADNPRATATWKEAEIKARSRGRVPIHIDDHQAAQRMADAIHAHPEAADILTDFQAEMSIFATDPATGVELRARPDASTIIGGRVTFGDIKTTVAKSQDEFERAAARYGYHIQAAFYRRTAQLLGLHDDPRLVFVVVEKFEPHLVYVVEWDAEATAEGDRLVRQAIETFARCRDANTWPGYPSGIRPMSLPVWAFEDEMEFSE